MEIEQQRHGAVTVVRPRGPLIGEDAERFLKRAGDALSQSFGRLVIDASGIVYVDSIGLEALVELSERLADSGQALRLSGSNETLREVFDLTETAQLFEHYDDVSDAVRSYL